MALHAVFFASGISGLVYQVVWVRQFAQIYGNTVHSAAIVVAIFMVGLGVGGYLFGAFADRRYQSRPDSLRSATKAGDEHLEHRTQANQCVVEA